MARLMRPLVLAAVLGAAGAFQRRALIITLTRSLTLSQSLTPTLIL